MLARYLYSQDCWVSECRLHWARCLSSVPRSKSPEQRQFHSVTVNLKPAILGIVFLHGTLKLLKFLRSEFFCLSFLSLENDKRLLPLPLCPLPPKQSACQHSVMSAWVLLFPFWQGGSQELLWECLSLEMLEMFCIQAFSLLDVGERLFSKDSKTTFINC